MKNFAYASTLLFRTIKRSIANMYAYISYIIILTLICYLLFHTPLIYVKIYTFLAIDVHCIEADKHFIFPTTYQIVSVLHDSAMREVKWPKRASPLHHL